MCGVRVKKISERRVGIILRTTAHTADHSAFLHRGLKNF